MSIFLKSIPWVLGTLLGTLIGLTVLKLTGATFFWWILFIPGIPFLIVLAITIVLMAALGNLT